MIFTHLVNCNLLSPFALKVMDWSVLQTFYNCRHRTNRLRTISCHFPFQANQFSKYTCNVNLLFLYLSSCFFLCLSVCLSVRLSLSLCLSPPSFCPMKTPHVTAFLFFLSLCKLFFFLKKIRNKKKTYIKFPTSQNHSNFKHFVSKLFFPNISIVAF